MTPLLHPALLLLLRKQWKARWRRLTRELRTLKGILRMAAKLLFWLLTLAGLALAAVFGPHIDPARIQPFVEAGLFLFTVLMLAGAGPDNGIFFTPAEVELLFPSPFRRRDLLLYRLSGTGPVILFNSLFFSLFASMAAPHWFFALCGIALAMEFIQLVSMALALMISIVGQAAYTRGRKLALAVGVILVAIGIAPVAVYPGQSGMAELVRRFAATPTGAVLLAPFHMFASTILAQHLLPDFIGWGVLALSVDAAWAVLVLRLDTNFLETSAAASEKLYRKMQRMQTGQGWMNLSKPVHRRLPMLPLWRGAGPVAWRQLVTGLRGSRGVTYFALSWVAIAILTTVISKDFARSINLMPMAPLMLLMYLPQLVQLDFRGDFARMETLKALPASASAIAAGQLIAPVVFGMLLELPIVLGLALWSGEWTMACAACAFLPVVNLLTFAVHNLVFLWYPRRPATPGSVDFQGVQRQALTGVAVSVIIVLAAGVAAGVGAGVYWISSGSWLAAGGVAWLITAGLGVAIVPWVARAFRRFDPSLDAPT